VLPISVRLPFGFIPSVPLKFARIVGVPPPTGTEYTVPKPLVPPL